MKKEEYKELLSIDIEKSILALIDEFGNSSNSNDLYSCKGRLNNIKSDFFKGLISWEQMEIKFNNIRYSILTQIDELIPSQEKDFSIIKEYKWDVFISYCNKEDKTIVADFVRELRFRGISTWFDQLNLEFGESVALSIANGIKYSKLIILIVSKQYLKQKWIEYELKQIKNLNDEEKIILPIWIDFDEEEIKQISFELNLSVGLKINLGVQAIAERIWNRFFKERKLKIQEIKFKGYTRLVIIPELGEVMMFCLENEEQTYYRFLENRKEGDEIKEDTININDVVRFDTVGNLVDKKIEEILYSGIPNSTSQQYETVFREFDEDFCLMLINKGISKIEDINNDSVYNLGTNSKPKLFVPIYGNSYFTVGGLTPSIQEKVDVLIDQVKRCGGINSETTWRSMYIEDDEIKMSYSINEHS